jgi:hypothetical protein
MALYAGKKTIVTFVKALKMFKKALSDHLC